MDSLKAIADSGVDLESINASNTLSSMLINSNPTLAMEYSIRALESSLKFNYRDGVGNAFNNIGVFYKNQGLYANALNYYNKAHDIFVDTQNKKGEAFALSNLATIYSLSKNYEVALEDFLHSFRIMKSLGLNEEMVGVLNNLGNIYKERNEDFRAIKIYEEAINISGSDSTKLISDPLINIGNIYYERNDFNKALESYKKALKIETANRNKEGMAACYLSMSNIYRKENNTELAIDYLQRAKLAALDANAKQILRVVYFQLSNIYKETNNMDLAYENINNHSRLMNELYNEQVAKSIEDIEISYSLLKSEEDYERTRFQSLQDRIKDTNIEAFFIIGVMAMIVLIALVFILVKLRRETGFYR